MAQLANIFDPFFENPSPVIKSPVKSGKGAAADKAAMALKNHSEAEKRRRERINGHFDTLRTLIPGSSKMEKAKLLANAIQHMKDLQKAASEATRGLIIPLDSDEVTVEEVVDVFEGERLLCIKASVCCDYTQEMLSDMKQSLKGLQLKLLRVELGTFRGRMKSVFFVSSYGEIASSGSVKRALRSVLDSFYMAQELASRDPFLNKKQRVSSSGEFW